MNRPEEIYHIVKSLDKNIFDTQFNFWKRYCDLKDTKWGLDHSGASNLDELNYKLRSSIMIRRMKNEVLKDMPDKIRQVIKFEGNQKLIEKEMLIYSNAKKEKFEIGNMADIIKLRQEIAIKKIPQILDYVNDTLESEDKLIIFAHHKEVIQTLEKELSKNNKVVKIDGSVSQEDRQKSVDEFQKGNANIFIGSIRACSEAITLTASSHVIFAEIDWTPGKNIQAEDRAYRIGQKNTVNITYLVYENSVDEYILNTNIDKESIIEEALR
jgi:SWI/SNF-related matrix-associated actin-dependent regulator 1 of chromatin subfamily A